MDGIMNKNPLTIVKEYEFNEPPIQKIDSLIDNSIRDFNITNNETVNFTISDKCMGMYELNKKLTIARANGFIFNQINKLSIKIYSNLSHIDIHYPLRLGSPPLHRQFFIKISKNRDYIQTFCNDRRNTFHFACRQWYLYNNPQGNMAQLFAYLYE